MNKTIDAAMIDITLDLQMFTANKTTDTTGTTGNDLSVEMKTYYHDQLIDNAEPELVHDQFGSKYPIPAGKGKTIEFRKYSPLAKALTPLTEGVKPAGSKLNVTNVLATIDQFGDFIELTDLLEVTAIDRNVNEAVILQGSQAGRTLNTVTREVLCGGSNRIFAPSVSGGTETPVLLRKDITTLCLLTPKVIRQSVAALKRFNTKPVIEGYFAGIIHTDVESDILGSTEWAEWQKPTRPEAMFAGEIGEIFKTRFASTTEAKIIGPEFIFGSAGANGVCRMTLHTALDGSGSVDILTKEAITTAQAAELTARIAAAAGASEVIKIYVGGKEATLASVTAGNPGTAKLVVTEAVVTVAEDAVICGHGAGKDGSAIYCTLIIGMNAYGTTEVTGLGLEHIVKQRGSAGTADPIDQLSTTGWKATKAAMRLVEMYMIRIEHSSSYGMSAESN